MAEAILVMTILGIIATIMITTIRPAEFKQKALKTLSKKVFSEIDSTMTQITINNTKTGQMDKLFIDNEDSHFSFGSDYSKIEQLFKKYLATTRKEYSASDKLGTFKTIVTNSPTSASQSPPFYLKDGALVFLGTGEKYGVSLDSTGTIDVEGCIMPKSLLGIVSVDINGEDEPNVAYQDQFHFPIGLNGVEYEYMCQRMEIANATPTPTPEPEPEPETPQDYPCTDEGYDAFCKQINGETAFYAGDGRCEWEGGYNYCIECYENKVRHPMICEGAEDL